MQVENDYDKGSTTVTSASWRRSTPKPAISPMVVSVTYGFGELDMLVPAYAVTIHKSQGSEYPAVIIPVMTQHYVMLQRNLLYTGITRARSLSCWWARKRP
jgi:exodeoxyribonuclease V alpha subunit